MPKKEQQWTQHLGDDQRIYGLGKHMHSVAGEHPLKDREEQVKTVNQPMLDWQKKRMQTPLWDDPRPPTAPPGVSYEKNRKQASLEKQIFKSVGVQGTLMEMGALVGKFMPHGPKDYKNRPNSNQLGGFNKYENAGNFNFGVEMEATGIPEAWAKRAAGMVQKMTGTSKLEWGSPWDASGSYGDDPADQKQIAKGYAWSRKKRNKE